MTKLLEKTAKLLFDEMFANDIDTIINVGASFAGCEQTVALADSHEKIYAAVGIHRKMWKN